MQQNYFLSLCYSVSYLSNASSKPCVSLAPMTLCPGLSSSILSSDSVSFSWDQIQLSTFLFEPFFLSALSLYSFKISGLWTVKSHDFNYHFTYAILTFEPQCYLSFASSLHLNVPIFFFKISIKLNSISTISIQLTPLHSFSLLANHLLSHLGLCYQFLPHISPPILC